MISHVSVQVNDICEAASFYDLLFGIIGYKQHAKFENIVAYGLNEINFIAIKPSNKQVKQRDTGVRVAFSLPTKENVDAFYNVCIDNGGFCEGPPGVRDYPYGEVYTAYIRDPFGIIFEMIHSGSAQ